MNKMKFPASLLVFILIPIIILDVWCGLTIHRLSEERAVAKKNYDEVNNIQYGILSVDKWMTNFRKIAFARIDDFALTPEQERLLKIEISNVLNAMINEAENIIDQDKKTLAGKLRRAAVNAFVDKDKIRSSVPRFSERILSEMRKPENLDKIKLVVQSKIDEYALQTRDTTKDTLQVNKLLELYKANTVENFNSYMERLMNFQQAETYKYSFIMIASLVVVLLIWWIVRNQQSLHEILFIFSAALGLIVLVVGLISPMIEIDARILKVNFLLIGEPIQFNNQILFYQSKSIFEVVKLLLATGKPDSVTVGILLLVFSIVFPISKLISTELFLMGNEKMRQNRIIRFFAFKSGKWSMADVMVVAIFMAYIGFKGILTSQLSGLTFQAKYVDSIATSHTALQPGFIIFIAFVLYGLILSEILKRIAPRKNSF